MRFCFFVLFTLLTVFSADAQIQSISAKVTDNQGTPLAGNFQLTDTAGKVIRNGGFDGGLVISGLAHDKLTLKLSSIMFNDTTIIISYAGKPAVELGTVIPHENTKTLGQVNITAATPLMRYGDSGNLEVNVAGTILATSSSVNEILTRTPGIFLPVQTGQVLGLAALLQAEENAQAK